MKKKKDTTEKLPGYPHYKKEDDITSTNTKVDADMEKYSKQNSTVKKNNVVDNTPSGPTAKLKKSPGKNDLTKEDLKALGDINEDMDEGEDELLLPDVRMNEKLLGGDLDFPESTEDDEDYDDDDEENNLFSQGQN